MKKLLLFVSFVVFVVISNHVNAQIVFYVETPPGVAGNYNFTYTQGWGADMDTIALTDTLVLIDDGSASDSLGCNSTANAAQIDNNIAVIYRGVCEFGKKAFEAQSAGAIAVVIINNVPGALVNMGAGAVGNSVTIPVLMISKEDGALLRSTIDAGQLTAFIGNKTGLFNNDLGLLKKNIVMSNSFAIPKLIAQNSTDFNIPVGAWIYNYGVNNQTNITLSAEVILNADTIYSETSATAIALNAGDSAFISLPVFSQTSYDAGYYNLIYSMNSDSVDNFPSDNMPIVTNFWINDSLFYSKSRFDSVTLMPIRTGSARPTTATDEFKWCIVLDSVNSGLTAYGISFSAGTGVSSALTDYAFKVELWKWNDNISTNITFDELVSLTEKDYFYNSNPQDEFVSVPFDNGITLQNNSKYLGCVVATGDSVYIGYDNGLDYNTNRNFLYDALFPLQAGNTWFPGGFGGDVVPAIILHFAPVPVSTEENQLAKKDTRPFPNPAGNNISIPLNGMHNGQVNLQIFDITGKLVKSDIVSMSNTNLFSVNTSSLENGAYFFHLKFEDKSVSSFPVVITH